MNNLYVSDLQSGIFECVCGDSDGFSIKKADDRLFIECESCDEEYDLGPVTMFRGIRPSTEPLINVDEIDPPEWNDMHDDIPVGIDLYVHVISLDGMTKEIVTDMYAHLTARQALSGSSGWMGEGVKYSKAIHWARK